MAQWSRVLRVDLELTDLHRLHKMLHATSKTPEENKRTVDQLFDIVGFGPFQYFLIVVGGCALVGDATEMMLLSMLGPIVHCFFNVNDPELEALLTTVVFVGMSLGGVVFGALADRKGRRVGLFATALLCSVGGVLSAVAPTFGFLVFFRFLVGVGLGGVAVAFTYVMEFIPNAHRGFIGTFIQGWVRFCLTFSFSAFVLTFSFSAFVLLMLFALFLVPWFYSGRWARFCR